MGHHSHAVQAGGNNRHAAPAPITYSHQQQHHDDAPTYSSPPREESGLQIGANGYPIDKKVGGEPSGSNDVHVRSSPSFVVVDQRLLEWGVNENRSQKVTTRLLLVLRFLLLSLPVPVSSFLLPLLLSSAIYLLPFQTNRRLPFRLRRRKEKCMRRIIIRLNLDSSRDSLKRLEELLRLVWLNLNTLDRWNR